MTFKIAPTSFTIDDQLDETFAVLKIDNCIGNPAAGSMGATIRSMLYTLGVDGIKNAYKGLALLPMLANSKVLASIKHKSTIVDFLSVCYYWTSVQTEGGNTDEEAIIPTEEQLIQAYVDQQGGSNKSTRNRKVVDLPHFSGKDEDWQLWKEKALATFKIIGLYSALTNPNIALLNPEDNTIIHGLLVRAMLQSDTHVEFCCMTDNEDDGYSAWKQLTDYFEQEQLVRGLLKTESILMDSLTLLRAEDYGAFVSNFMRSKNRTTTYLKLAKEKEVTMVREFEVSDWKGIFLEKINVSLLQSRVESCLQDDEMTLWTTIIALKSLILEKRTKHSKQKRSPKVEQNEKVENGNSDTDSNPPAKAPVVTIATLHNLVNQLPNGDKKTMLKDFLVSSKSSVRKHPNGERYARKKKNRRNTISGKAPRIDAGAQAIIGGSDVASP